MTDTTLDETALATIPQSSALAVLTNPEQFDAFEKKIREEVAKHVPDVTTDKGRKAIKALAFRVVKSKTAILEQADALTEEARKTVKAVNDSKKTIAERLDALRDEVKAPVTAWEAAEAEKAEWIKETIDSLRRAAVIPLDATSESILAKVDALAELVIDGETFGDSFDIAANLRRSASDALLAALERIRQQEADTAELAAMRAEKATREAREAEEAAERHAAEQLERHHAMLKESARLEQERQDREREEAEEAERLAEEQRQEAIRVAAEEAANAARVQAEQEAREAEEARAAEVLAQHAEEMRVAAEQRAERERVAAEELAEANRLREKSEAEALRLKVEKADRERAEEEERQAIAARQKDREHKAKVMGDAKEAMLTVMGETLGENSLPSAIRSQLAVAIVRAIVAGEIPHTEIKF